MLLLFGCPSELAASLLDGPSKFHLAHLGDVQLHVLSRLELDLDRVFVFLRDISLCVRNVGDECLSFIFICQSEEWALDFCGCLILPFWVSWESPVFGLGVLEPVLCLGDSLPCILDSIFEAMQPLDVIFRNTFGSGGVDLASRTFPFEVCLFAPFSDFFYHLSREQMFLVHEVYMVIHVFQPFVHLLVQHVYILEGQLCLIHIGVCN